MATDPKTTLCLISSAETVAAALADVKKRFEERVAQEGADYVFSACDFRVEPVQDKFGTTIVASFWLERIPRTTLTS